MYNSLSLKNNNISLLNIEERNIKNVNYSFYVSKIKFKKINNIHMQLLVKSNISGQIIGYILSYNYNKIDGHIRIYCYIDTEYIEGLYSEVISLFCNYLFVCFPIRKIYFELINNHEYNFIDFLQNIGFEKEACLKEDTFFNNQYYDKYILTLNSNIFFEVNKNGK